MYKPTKEKAAETESVSQKYGMTFEVWDYSEIVVVDPRYYAGNAGELMRDYEVDEVLFLYRVNTFTQDNHLYGFLE